MGYNRLRLRSGHTPPSGGGGGSRQLLGQSDFSYLGYYDHIVGGGGAGGNGGGLSGRYVSGTLRLLLANGSDEGSPGWREVTLPGSFGGTVTQVIPAGGGALGLTLMSGGIRRHCSWDKTDTTRLWMAEAGDYPDDPELNYTSTLSNHTVSTSGSVSNFKGYWGFQGVGQRAVYGGTRNVPTWFQTAYSVGPYVSGFGGYTSRWGQGLTPSAGPMLIFHQDPVAQGYTEQSSTQVSGGISSSLWKIGADFRSGSGSGDWYPNYSSRTYDRGSRANTNLMPWYDGVDSRPNPSTRPTYPTDYQSGVGQWWVSNTGGAAPNDPNGFARFTYGDTYEGTMCWIDNDAGTQTKHGVVMVANLADGYAWYASSTLNSDNRDYEVHIFDPADIGSVIGGSLAVYKLVPKVAFSIRSMMTGVESGSQSGGSNWEERNIDGAWFDDTTGRLYMQMLYQDNTAPSKKSRIHVFQVATS